MAVMGAANMEKIKYYYRVLGPGLLSAGAAIGVSHLVQSTRAGAEFGFELLWVVLIANLIKYPFFEMSPRYTAATGQSLLQGYRSLGKWPLWIVMMMTFSTMFIVQAAVTIVTAGIAVEIFQIPVDAKIMSFILLVICFVLLSSGRYAFLDHFIKFIIVALVVTTLASLFGAVSAERVVQATNPFDWDDKTHLFFLVGLAGWMPAPMDLSLWHSIWMQEKQQLLQEKMSLKNALLDFNVGYIGTAVLATCFVSLGALVMHGSGQVFSPKAATFAGQLITLYTSSLGSWTYSIIAIAAFSTMFSTTLTCFDASPRVLCETWQLISGNPKKGGQRSYFFWLVVVAIGSLILLFGFIQNMKEMVAIATTLSFVLAPVYALLNYILLNRADFPKEARLGVVYRCFCQACLLGLAVFSLWFLVLRYG